MNDNEHRPQKTRPIRIEGRTEFTQEEIEKARKAKKLRLAIEMDIYNLRSLRGDFDRF